MERWSHWFSAVLVGEGVSGNFEDGERLFEGERRWDAVE